MKRVLQKGQGTRVDNVSEWRVDALVRKTVQSWVVFLTPSVLTLNPSEKLFANEGILSPIVAYPLVSVVFKWLPGRCAAERKEKSSIL